MFEFEGLIGPQHPCVVKGGSRHISSMQQPATYAMHSWLSASSTTYLTITDMALASSEQNSVWRTRELRAYCLWKRDPASKEGTSAPPRAQSPGLEGLRTHLCRLAAFAQVPLTQDGAEGGDRRPPPFENTKLRAINAAPHLRKVDWLTLFKANATSSRRALRTRRPAKWKVVCSLACMGKDAILSRTLTHAWQSESLTDQKKLKEGQIERWHTKVEEKIRNSRSAPR